MTDAITCPRSDTVAGYVAEGRGLQDGRFTITTSAGCDIDMELAENVGAEVLLTTAKDAVNLDLDYPALVGDVKL